jgi:hypothetical protein
MRFARCDFDEIPQLAIPKFQNPKSFFCSILVSYGQLDHILGTII